MSRNATALRLPNGVMPDLKCAPVADLAPGEMMSFATAVDRAIDADR